MDICVWLIIFLFLSSQCLLEISLILLESLFIPLSISATLVRNMHLCGEQQNRVSGLCFILLLFAIYFFLELVVTQVLSIRTPMCSTCGNRLRYSGQ